MLKRETYLNTLYHPSFVNHATGERMSNDTGWQDRHVRAFNVPHGFEAAIVSLLTGWAIYADAHRARYESKLGDDYVLGVAWAATGRAIHSLLDGETGRLDCGTLSSFIHDTLTSEGFNADA